MFYLVRQAIFYHVGCLGKLCFVFIFQLIIIYSYCFFFTKFAPMKKCVVSLLLFLTASLTLVSANSRGVNVSTIAQKDSIAAKNVRQDTDSVAAVSRTASTLLDAEGNVVDTSVVKLPNTYAWKIDTRFGDRTLVPMDTIRETFYRSVLVEGKGVAVNYLGNVGSPMQQVEFFAREEGTQFPFADALQTWRRSPEKQLFLNTKIPYSTLHYQAGGGKQVAENHFKAELSSNFGKRLNVGFNFDYIYARGHYKSLFNKQTSYDVNASYIGDKYKMHLFMGNNNLNMSDNGGITNDKYITNPESEDLETTRGNSLDIPVVFDEGIKNKLRGRHIFITNSYDLGRDTEEIQIDDTTSVWQKKANYIAPASIILTTHYADQRRSLKGSNSRVDIDSLNRIYAPNWVDDKGNVAPHYDEAMDDYMSHYTFTNTLAFRMNEGFREWTKFGLTAFIEYEMRKFLLPDKGLKGASETVGENIWYFGGQLSKNQGKHLRFNANAVKAINNNDVKLEGDIVASFNLFGKGVTAKANAYFKSEAPKFFQENFRFRNWLIEEDFNDTKRFYVGGEINFPKFSFSETKVSGGYENITDLIYWGADRKVAQASGNVNVFALKLDQKLRAGILNFEVQALLQKSTDEKVLPLPAWTVYANLYLKTMVSKVLTLQLGVDAYMHAKYYLPGYDPIQMQFYNQRELQMGEFPHANVYVNLHLKYTRFFVMMYNVGEKLGNRQSFTSLHHPVNPMMIRWGLSWKFNN